VLPRCDGVLSGYMGAPATGEAILDAVDRVRAANQTARYCCDPVIGDKGRGVFVRPGVPEFMRERAVPAADIVTPNQFELDYLSGLTSRTLDETIKACGAVHAMGPGTVLVTSLFVDDTPKDAIDVFASGPDGRFRTRTPLLDIALNGTGDAAAALFFAHLLRTRSTAGALSLMTSSIFGLLRLSAEAKSREILLIDAQQEFASPSRVFRAEPVV
jgi:pyridoxine kinase